MSNNSSDQIAANRNASLVELLDRLIDTGVVLQGDAMLSVGDVDLVYLGLKLVLCSADRAGYGDERMGYGGPPQTQPPVTGPATAPETSRPPTDPTPALPSTRPSPSPSATSAAPPGGLSLAAVQDIDTEDLGSLQLGSKSVPSESGMVESAERAIECVQEAVSRLDADSRDREAASGLVQLVLTLVELLRQLMERQALRRMERGTVNDAQIERMGETFMALQTKIAEMCAIFGIEESDLNLDLGPLGTLVD